MTCDDLPAGLGARVALFLVLNLVFFAYFTPSFIAVWRKKQQLAAIVVLNFFGVTGICWGLALFLALVDFVPHFDFFARKSDVEKFKSLEKELEKHKLELKQCREQLDDLSKLVLLVEDHQNFSSKMLQAMAERKNSSV